MKLKHLIALGLVLTLCVVATYVIIRAVVDNFYTGDFTVTYHGVTTGEFKGRATFMCSSINGSPVHPVIDLSSKSDIPGSVSLLLPLNTKPGQYSFSSSTAKSEDFLIYVTVQDKGVYRWFQYTDVVSGTIELDNLPTRDSNRLSSRNDRRVRGRFEAEVANAREGRLTISGEFDFKADSMFITTACSGP